MRIADIYDELKREDMCKSGYDFSRDYLGKDPSYFSVCKSRGVEPSVEALMVLSLALQHRSQHLKRSDNKEIRKAGAKLAAINDQVSDAVVTACMAKIR